MITIRLTSEADFGEWADKARRACAAGIRPEGLLWRGPSSPGSLFDGDEDVFPPNTQRRPSAPKMFSSIARRVICHSDPERFARLYRILWRLQSERELLQNPADVDTAWLMACDKSVRRDRHKMHAFVRFRKVGVRELASGEMREQFIAWFEPDHHITALAAPFFAERFANMDWAIFTPKASALWNGQALQIGTGASKDGLPQSDCVEDLWRTYFASTFNPARLKVRAMMSEMPKKYWKNLPEADLIPGLIAGAQARAERYEAESITEKNPLARKLSQRKNL